MGIARRPLVIIRGSYAGVAKSVDATDLKSVGPKGLCRFKSGRPHQFTRIYFTTLLVLRARFTHSFLLKQLIALFPFACHKKYAVDELCRSVDPMTNN